MRLNYLRALLLVLFASLAIGLPVNQQVDHEVEAIEAKPKSKRFDVNTYLSSIGNFFTTSDVQRNISFNGIKMLDIYGKKENYKKPVVIYVYGGTWHMGEKSLYSKLGDYLKNNGFLGVIPNYVQFPFGTAYEMVHDISESIKWVKNNIERYGGDSNNITILGHSSGAHLAVLTLFQSNLKLNQDRYFRAKDVPRVQRVVLLNGVYDFDVFSDIAKNTGKVPENSDFEKFATNMLGVDNSCPTDILKRYGDKSIADLGADRFIVVHSDQDVTVPVTSPNGLVEQMRRVSNVQVIPYMIKGYYHCGVTEGLMNNDANAQRIVTELLKM